MARPMHPQLIFKTVCTALCFFLAACASKNYGDDQYQLRMATAGKDIMWVPSKVDMVHKMLEAARVGPQDIVYDLGSGDGIIPLEAARKYGVPSVGIEYNPDLVELAKRNAKRADLERLVSFKRGDIFVEDFSEATVVTLYLGEALNAKLMPRLLQMRPGTRVVSNVFRIESWIPDQEIRSAAGDKAFLWIVPAQVAGLWTFSGIPGVTQMSVQVRQKKQFFDAQVFFDGRRVAQIEDALLRGSAMELQFSHAGRSYALRGQVEGGQFTGQLNNDPRIQVTGRRGS
jgi:precorrin-6B methylase 2